MKRFARVIVNVFFLALLLAGVFMLGRLFERYLSFIPLPQAHPVTAPDQVSGSLPLTQADRLYGLGLAWEKGKSSFPFFQKTTTVNWDAAYQDAIPEVLNARDDLEYYRVLQRFTALLNDGHSRVQLPQALQDQLDRPPLRLSVYQEELYLSRWLDPKPELEKYLGARLVAVDGQPTGKRAADLQPYLSASTPQDLWMRTAAEILNGTVGSEVSLEVQLVSGETETLKLKRNTKELFAGQSQTGPMIITRDLGGGLRYVRISSFDNKAVVSQFNQAFPNFKGVKGLVIDVRDNGGGNSGYGAQIYRRLIRWPAQDVQWQTRERIAYFDAAKMSELWFYGPPSIQMPQSLNNQYTGPVVVLTNAGTYSAAENFTALFQINQRGPVIGEATGGSTGQPIFFKLPGGGTGAILTKWDRYPDGKEFVGVGIQPEIPVTPTPADWAAGRDAVLDRAIAVLQGE